MGFWRSVSFGHEIWKEVPGKGEKETEGRTRVRSIKIVVKDVWTPGVVGLSTRSTRRLWFPRYPGPPPFLTGTSLFLLPVIHRLPHRTYPLYTVVTMTGTCVTCWSFLLPTFILTSYLLDSFYISINIYQIVKTKWRYVVLLILRIIIYPT